MKDAGVMFFSQLSFLAVGKCSIVVLQQFHSFLKEMHACIAHEGYCPIWCHYTLTFEQCETEIKLDVEAPLFMYVDHEKSHVHRHKVNFFDSQQKSQKTNTIQRGGSM